MNQLDLFKDSIATNKPAAMKKAQILNVSELRVKRSVLSYMKEKNLSKTSMARKTGISYNYFIQLMNGKKEMTTKSAINLLHACEGKLVKSIRS
jgi:hypothetical protein